MSSYRPAPTNARQPLNERPKSGYSVVRGEHAMNSLSYGIAPPSSFAAPESTLLESMSDVATTYMMSGTGFLPTSSASTGTRTSSTASSSVSSSASPTYPNAVVPQTKNGPPAHTVLVAVLFKRSLVWSLVTSQRNATAQLFTFMPRLLAAGMHISPELVSTKELRPYSSNGTVLTMYLAYIPSDKKDALQDALLSPPTKMTFPGISGVEFDLLNQIDTNYDLYAYKDEGQPKQAGALSTPAVNALISCFSIVAGLVVLGLVAWLVRRYFQRRDAQRKLKRRNTIESFAALSPDPVPMSFMFPEQQISSFYAGDSRGSPVTAFESDGPRSRFYVPPAHLANPAPPGPTDSRLDPRATVGVGGPLSGGSDGFCYDDKYRYYSDLIPNVNATSSVSPHS